MTKGRMNMKRYKKTMIAFLTAAFLLFNCGTSSFADEYRTTITVTIPENTSDPGSSDSGHTTDPTDPASDPGSGHTGDSDTGHTSDSGSGHASESTTPVKITVPGIEATPGIDLGSPLIESAIEPIVEAVRATRAASLEAEETLEEETVALPNGETKAIEEEPSQTPSDDESEVMTVIDPGTPGGVAEEANSHAALIIAILTILAAGGVGAVAVVSKKVKTK